MARAPPCAALTTLSSTSAALMIFDEPTNNLDTVSVDHLVIERFRLTIAMGSSTCNPIAPEAMGERE
ncbi:hypothetical protein SAMN06295943_0335 [Agreia sp. VKM Ac-1783]|nr:hypothetical protein SAMN06295943_0335 [Agreia sp. VKM Ac-1783]